MWLTRCLDLVYPRRCAACGAEPQSAEDHWCWTCRADLRVIAFPFCSRCGNPIEGRSGHAYTCFHCNQQEPHFDRARCAARFEGDLADLVHDFKYHRALWLQEDLVELLYACFQVHYQVEEFDTIACVPLFHARQRERGYNQAALLAEGLGRRLNLPVATGSLRRLRPTSTQTNLTARDRASNVAGAFEVTRPGQLGGRRVLLVDDVMTTGATVNECARALKKGSASSVAVIALARGG